MIPADFLRGLYRPLVPDRVSVTFRRQTAPGVYAADATLPDCWWRPREAAEGAPSRGVYLRHERTWYVPKGSYAGPPYPGDLVVGPATAIDPVAATWTVLSVGEAGALGAWELTCVSLQLREGLRSLGALARPASTTDAAGKRVPGFATVASGIPCRVQPAEAEARSDAHDAGQTVSRYTAFLGFAVAPQADDVFEADAARYLVAGWKDQERLDALMTFDLVVRQ